MAMSAGASVMDLIPIWERLSSSSIIDNLLASLIFLIAQTVLITFGLGILFRWQNKKKNKPIVDIFHKRFLYSNASISDALSSLSHDRKDITELFYQMAIYHAARLKEIVTLQTSAFSSVAVPAYEYVADCEYMLILIKHIMYSKYHPEELVYIDYPHARFNRMIKFQEEMFKDIKKNNQQEIRENANLQNSALDTKNLPLKIPNIISNLDDERVKNFSILVVLDSETIQRLHVPAHITGIRTTVGYAA